MNIAVTGSIATDHLMTFAGRFADSLVVEQLDKISVSFLAQDLQIRRGGIAANIAFGMGNLGVRPVLVGAVGEDFVEYRSWLDRHGVDCESVHVSTTQHTARFVCTTDEDMAQIATFYAGAMSEARSIELQPIVERVGGLDLVVVSPNDPDAMLRHTAECRTRGIPFVADPSQQLAFGEGPFIRDLIRGAAYLFTNEYEADLVAKKTGWSPEEILDQVEVQVTTKGKDGAVIQRKGDDPIEIPVAREVRRADPTGVGDAFRAGFLAGLVWGLPLQQCGEVGSMLATYVIETVGTQEYDLRSADFLSRLEQSYGPETSEAVRRHLRAPRD
ncbi:carbohydrate kinase family protein [Calidifontibacter sp. DB0510]|uniref:Carbohydrate kinase family protein n=1 Tax=Metallococcus carri TaxID=1656884 RepID=A0A967B1U6_9MICO|nr:carbohydrate kinase family protein [Metallococcus carri]NHN55963.1 carbohydrate kinase family protein [Metallococcus carri]NOP37580.1 carbohydrate kinase family protein [Calidifontibacter sp. DB2511S]